MKKLTLFLSAMLLACATNLWAETATYQHVFNAKPSTGNNIELSNVNWNIEATNLNNYNSSNYAGVQFGTSSKNGAITLTSSSDWNYNGNTKITEVRLWLNVGGTSVTPSVTIGGKPATSDGATVTKNSSAGSDWTKATKVTFTPAADGNTGVVVINVTSVKAGYICAMEIDSESDNTPAATLTALTITGTPDKTNYEEGETFDPTGLVVTGTYSEGDPKEITSGITWTITPEELATTTTAVQVVATVGTISSEAYSVPVKVTKHVITPGTYTIALNAGLYSVGTGNNATEQTVTKNDITITSGCTSSATTKTNYQTDHIRYYKYSYLKLAVPTGYDITKIVFTAFDDTWDGSITASVSTYNADTKIWTGVANSVDFSFGAQNRIKTIAVTYELHQDISVETPVLTAEDGKVAGGEFVEAFELTMTCATEDATIFYTLDESDPKTSETAKTYTAAITISETTTVRAIAKAGEEWSREATETYTKLVALTTMDEIFTTATEAGKSTVTKYVTFNNWVVTGVTNSNAYLTDGTKGLIIYTSSHGFKAGDMLSGTVSCDITLFNGNAEIKGLKANTTGLTVTEGGTAPVQTPAIKDLSAINTGSIISLSNLTYNGGVLTDSADNTITPYGTFITLPTTMTSGKKYNVKGVYIDFNGTKEIAPLAESDIQEVTTPSAIGNAAVETPAVKTIENGQLVIIRDGKKYNAMGVRLQ